MDSKVIYAEFHSLFIEVKRRLNNQDSKDVWSTKVTEFIRALAVKDRHSPGGLPPILDVIWHECILNTRDYARLCKRVRGKFVHHTTVSEQDDEVDKISRVDSTILKYRKRFREEPREIWDFPEETPKIIKKGPYGFYVKNLEGDVYWIKAEGSNTIEEIKKKLVLKRAASCVDEIRLIHNGRQLEDGRTCADYNIRKEDTLHLVLRLRGC